LNAARSDTLDTHASWCSGGCSRWVVTGAPTCMPYPCRCPETKAQVPEWVQLAGDVTCWWRRKTDGALTSRCPCWGDRREGKPEECCSWHMANPQFLDDRHAAFLALVEAADDEPPADATFDASSAEPHREPDPLTWDSDGEAWADRRPVREPYVRRWTAAELDCACGATPPRGVHCVSCCVTFASEMAASMHRTAWSQPCRTPEEICDVDTGVPLLQLNGDGAWAIDWQANAGLWQAARYAAKSIRHTA
jgi:hypothetical protein